MKKDLENALEELYADIPPISNQNRMEQTIMEARKAMGKVSVPTADLSFWMFFLLQIGFIKKRVWGIQFGAILLCGFTLFDVTETNNAVGLISTVIPLIFLAGSGELSRAFVYNTVEMEMSTRFTLHQVMLSRITLLGLTDVLVLTVIGGMTAFYLPVETPRIFMYLCVPFLITSFGCLCILNHIHTKNCNYYCGVWGVVVMILTFCLAKGVPVLYETALIWGWGILFVISLLGAFIECRLLLQKCTKSYVPRELAMNLGGSLWNSN